MRSRIARDRPLLLMRLAAAAVVVTVVALVAYHRYYDQAPWAEYPRDVRACGQLYVAADVPSPRYVSMAQVRDAGGEERARRRTPDGARAVFSAPGEHGGCAREAYLQVADDRAVTYTLDSGFSRHGAAGGRRAAAPTLGS